MQSITLSALSVILPGFDAFEFLYLRNRERYSFPEFMEDKKAWMKRAVWKGIYWQEMLTLASQINKENETEGICIG